MNPLNLPNYPDEFKKIVGKPYSYHEHIIQKPEKATIQKRKRHIVVVDSRFRDTAKYSSPSDYTIDFDEHYKYVTDVEMISYCIPRDPIYLINSNNNLIKLSEIGNIPPKTHDITLDNGEYNLRELSDEIHNKFISQSSTYTADHNDENKTITITEDSSTKFSIISNLFGISTQSRHKIMHTLQPLNKCPYVMLKIDQLRRYDSVDGNAAIRDSFALVPLGNDFKELLTTHNYGNVKSFNPPLPKLSKFKIKFLNPLNNQPWNFRNRDHVMIFVITTLNQSGKYSDTLQ